MDRFSFLGSVHAGFIEDLYEKYLSSPDAVEPSWRAFFQGYDFAQEGYGDLGLASSNGHVDAVMHENIKKEFQVLNLVADYRKRGHLFTETNPVRARRKYSPTLALENYGLSKDDLDTRFEAATEVGASGARTLREIIEHLNNIYCKSIGVEFVYIRDVDRFDWLKKRIHINDNHPEYSLEQKKNILHKLNEAVAFESFLNTKFVGQKRFSIEGAESLIPAMDMTINHAAGLGVEEFVLGMAHRGRLNVLSNIFGKPQSQIFSEFEGKEFAEDEGFDGDVKYHLGYTTFKSLNDGRKIKLNISPNPSHLEAVNPVVGGITRAKLEKHYNKDLKKVMPILVHGDAAIAAQGVVYESIQMEILDGYTSGGTLHIVINNQVGFTTNYLDARSSVYCTDVAKVLNAPVFHVNGDDVEAVCHAMQIAVEYRQKFNRDVFIDLLCYRKYGHNEGDEPRFTQPLLYKAISKHPNPREIYNKRLLKQGLVGEELVREMEKEFKSMLEEKYDESKKIERNVIVAFMEDEWTGYKVGRAEDFFESPKTGYDLDKLKGLAKKITTLPEGKKFLNKVERLFKDRHAMVFDRNALDWGMGELLAYASLLDEGYNVRLSGEDSERGTFSHRHAVVKMLDSEEEYVPLTIVNKQAQFSVFNSLLSEYGVMGFDYGYAMTRPDTLTLWEAQFGDFVNGAQIIIDQFLTAAEDKWKAQNGLVLLLPHGYEGQGAEHSSARLERFLQACAEYNIQVANATTPANYFHLLRRQMHREFRKPLVIMTPKSLLRHPKCVSTLEDMAEGAFREVIDDNNPAPKDVTKVVFCSGKFYYDLLDERENREDNTTALVRMEQLYPLPQKQIETVLKKYKGAKTKIWAQEEPANMGAWTYILWRFPERLDLVSIPESASPAAGSNKTAIARQKAAIKKVFES